MPSHPRVVQSDTRNNRMIAVSRLVLAVLAVLVAYYHGIQDVRPGAATDIGLALYLTYSTVLVLLIRCPPFPSGATAYWVDVGWYIVLLGVGGAHNVFFFFLLICLSILVASFQDGFRAGVRITSISVVLLTLAGLGVRHIEPGVALHHFLLWPVGLLVFGGMVAYWGGSEHTLKRRLALLKDISTLANPRFGTDHTFGAFLKRLQVFYDADTCVLVLLDHTTGECNLRRADRHDPQAVERVEAIPEGMMPLLLALPADQALIVHDSSRGWRRWSPRADVQAYDVATGTRVAVPPQINGLLDAASCITIPWHFQGKMIGQLYLTAPGRRTFGASDVTFLLQVLAHTMPIIDNIRLVDRLASDAAETERQRIAHDLHDSIIQPYVGLQLGLVAVLRKYAASKTDVQDDLQQLLTLVNAELVDMRAYVWGLSQGNGYKDGLLPAVERFAQQFTEATGIAVHVEVAADMCINDRLATAVFRMVAEGLSNVRRHTDSPWATIGLACCNGHFLLRIENDDAAGTAVVPFRPRSITERAAALGGQVCVRRTEDARVAVIVNIPL
jgi:signal transduction histidine kinase